MTENPPLGALPANRTHLAYFILRVMDQCAHIATSLAALQKDDREEALAELGKTLELQKKLIAELNKFVGGIELD